MNNTAYYIIDTRSTPTCKHAQRTCKALFRKPARRTLTASEDALPLCALCAGGTADASTKPASCEGSNTYTPEGARNAELWRTAKMTIDFPLRATCPFCDREYRVGDYGKIVKHAVKK